MKSGMLLPIQSTVNTLDLQSKLVSTSQTDAKFSKYLTRELEDASYKNTKVKKSLDSKESNLIKTGTQDQKAKITEDTQVNADNTKIEDKDQKIIINKQDDNQESQDDSKEESLSKEEQLNQAIVLLQSVLKELGNISQKEINSLNETLNKTDSENKNSTELKDKLNEISSLLNNLKISKDENNNVKVEVNDGIKIDSQVQQELKEILEEVTKEGLIKENFARILEKKDYLNKAQEKMLEFVNKISEEQVSLQDLKQAVANVVKTEENPNNQVLGAMTKEVKDIIKDNFQNLTKDFSSDNGQDENKQLINKDNLDNKLKEKIDLSELKQNHKFNSGIEATIKEAINSNLTKPSEGLGEVVSSNVKASVAVDPKIFTTSLDVKQIANDININFLKGNSEVAINMKPEYLGELNVKMVINADQVTLTMKTDNSVAKQVLEASINQLKDALSQHGIKIASYEISTSSDLNYNNQTLNSKFEDSNKNNAKQNSFFDNQGKEFTEKESNQEKQNNFTWKRQGNLGVLDYFA